MPSLLLLAIGFLTVCVIVVAWMICRAPEGHENDGGFNAGEEAENTAAETSEETRIS